MRTNLIAASTSGISGWGTIRQSDLGGTQNSDTWNGLAVTRNLSYIVEKEVKRTCNMMKYEIHQQFFKKANQYCNQQRTVNTGGMTGSLSVPPWGCSLSQGFDTLVLSPSVDQQHLAEVETNSAALHGRAKHYPYGSKHSSDGDRWWFKVSSFWGSKKSVSWFFVQVFTQYQLFSKGFLKFSTKPEQLLIWKIYHFWFLAVSGLFKEV